MFGGGGSQRIKADLAAFVHSGENVEVIFPSRIRQIVNDQQPGLKLITYPSIQRFGTSQEKVKMLLDMHTQSINPFFRSLLRKRFQRYSMIYAHFPWSVTATYSVTKQKIPLVYVAHNCEYALVTQATQNPAIHKFIRFVENQACQKSMKILCASEGVAEELRHTYKLSNEKLTVVPNTADCDFFSQSNVLYNRVEERQKLNLPTSSFILLFPGRMDYRANLDALEFILSEIVPALLCSLHDIKIMIVGAQIPKWCLESKLVYTYSDVPDMRRFLAIADAVIVPLRTGGGTRLKILEAFAAKIPVISTAKGAEGIKCVNEHHLLIAEETANDFTLKIEALSTNEILRKKLAHHAYELVVRDYSIEAASKCLQQVINGIQK